MTKQQVISIMGEPESTASPRPGVEVLRYKLMERGTPGVEYFVLFVDGKMEQYGQMGDFNSIQNPTLNLDINNH